MQEVEQWLAKLGMSEYAERFAENRINFTVLPDLTDQDLKSVWSLVIVAKSCTQSPGLMPRLRQWFWIPNHRPPSPLQRYSVC
jgi:SAM domain (Sterile alpha motif)